MTNENPINPDETAPEFQQPQELPGYRQDQTVEANEHLKARTGRLENPKKKNDYKKAVALGLVSGGILGLLAYAVKTDLKNNMIEANRKEMVAEMEAHNRGLINYLGEHIQAQDSKLSELDEVSKNAESMRVNLETLAGEFEDAQEELDEKEKAYDTKVEELNSKVTEYDELLKTHDAYKLATDEEKADLSIKYGVLMAEKSKLETTLAENPHGFQDTAIEGRADEGFVSAMNDYVTGVEALKEKYGVAEPEAVEHTGVPLMNAINPEAPKEDAYGLGLIQDALDYLKANSSE